MAKTTDCWFFRSYSAQRSSARLAAPQLLPLSGISAKTAPAGGWAQIKIFAAKPMTIASGHIIAES